MQRPTLSAKNAKLKKVTEFMKMSLYPTEAYDIQQESCTRCNHPICILSIYFVLVLGLGNKYGFGDCSPG